MKGMSQMKSNRRRDIFYGVENPGSFGRGILIEETQDINEGGEWEVIPKGDTIERLR